MPEGEDPDRNRATYLGPARRAVMGVDGVSEKKQTSWVDNYDKPLPGTARRASENAANSPWLQEASKYETDSARYSPELFSNPAMQGAPVALTERAASGA